MDQGKLFGMYRGIVLKHLSHGKCKIFVPGVYNWEYNSYDKADQLPSAEQATGIFGGNVNGNGIYSYPNIGATVWCFFENGDQNFPVYWATTEGGNVETKSCLTNFNRALCKVGSHPDDAYTHVLHFGKDNETNFTDIEIQETGNIKIKTVKDGLECMFQMDDQGNITLKSTKSITIDTNLLILKGSQQVDIKSQRIKETGYTGITMITPSVFIDTGTTGSVQINSQSSGVISM